ncbi:MAG: hypothetical protein ACODAJ_05610, partial [Planctomycetota bacterium]
ADLLPAPLEPVVRVRFRLLDRLEDVDTVIHLPEHLAAAMGEEEVPARKLAEAWRDVAQAAADRLQALRTADDLTDWSQHHFPDLTAQIEGLDDRRRQMAHGDTTPEQMRELWDQEKALRLELLGRTVRQIARDWQLRDLDYWDSRGALLPWAVALGGEAFYQRLLAEAEVYEEAGARD